MPQTLFKSQIRFKVNYLQVTFNYNPDKVNGEILLAHVAEVPFESFAEETGELQAFILKDEFDENELLNIDFLKENNIDYTVSEIEQVNWNEEWEKNFEPIFVEDKCVVRASFHNIEKKYDYDILIDPKMSFGTGHHATTYLMLSYMLHLDFEEKVVLDMGTGTGVLAILAALKGAKSALAIDNNPWAFENSIENVEANKCSDVVEVIQADASGIGAKTFEIILANINKNVIKDDFELYTNCLEPGGTVLFSGILTEDIGDVVALAEKAKLNKIHFGTRDKWSLLVFSKNS